MAPYMNNVKSHLCKDVFGEIELGLVVLEEKNPKINQNILLYLFHCIRMSCIQILKLTLMAREEIFVYNLFTLFAFIFSWK